MCKRVCVSKASASLYLIARAHGAASASGRLARIVTVAVLNDRTIHSAAIALTSEVEALARARSEAHLDVAEDEVRVRDTIQVGRDGVLIGQQERERERSAEALFREGRCIRRPD